MIRRAATALILLALVVAAYDASAARWGPDGHTGATFGVARKTFGLPSNVAKVIALGSMAPDYFEFDAPAAHAQSHNPPISDDRIAVTERVYHRMQEDALRASNKWHRFYLNAAVNAMKQGKREQAAFLLGYAMHNSQDFSPHRGLPNLAHATFDDQDMSPDKNPQRLADTRLLTEGDIAEFRNRVGPENWRLFRGESVRRPGKLFPEVPPSLSVFGPDLAGWDPESGVIPPRRREQRLGRLFDAAISKALSVRGYTVDERGRIKESARVWLQNFLYGMFQRQGEMRAFLDVPRRPSNPGLPPLKDDLEQLAIYVVQALDFLVLQPLAFYRLSREDQRMLIYPVWIDILKRDYTEMAAKRRAARAALAGAVAADAEALAALRERERENLRWVEMERMRIRRLQAAWQQALQTRPSRPPAIDGRPREEPPPSRWRTPRVTEDTETPSRRIDDRPPRPERHKIKRLKFGKMPTLKKLQGLGSGVFN